MFTVIDLFCGVGGFAYGFKEEGFEIILGVDHEQHKLKTFQHNLKPKSTLKTDISQLTANKIFRKINQQRVDVVIGSPPCQDFSYSNRKTSSNLSLYTGRIGLPYQFFRLVIALKPVWFVMENVEHFFRTTDGEFLMHMFLPYGYKVSLYILNAADFGVPQKRTRGFLIGNRLGLISKIEPETEKHLSIKDAISDLVDVETVDDVKILSPCSDYQKTMRNSSNIVKNHIKTNHNQEVISILSKIKQGQSYKDLPGVPPKGSKFSGAYYRPYYDEPSRTITTRFDTPSSDGESVHPILNRCFTPREAARIQSFDDSFEFFGSREEVRLQIGDAVPPLLSRAIARKIKSVLSSVVY